GQQFLGHYRLEVKGQGLANGVVHVGWKQVEDAAHGAGGRGRVDGAEYQVAGLGGVDAGFEGVAGAQLADQDDVRVLPHRVLQGLVPVHDVQADLTLVDVGFLVGEHEFNRVFHREDVERFTFVDVIEHRGNRRAFARSGDARQNDQALIVVA